MGRGDVTPPSSVPPSDVDYTSSSPDELSLVQFAAQCGYVLLERQGSIVWVKAGREDGRDRKEEWEVLSVCEFTSVRKRMSAIVRREGVVRLFMKGADDVVLARLSPRQAASIPRWRSTLDTYATKGLRTLVFATRVLSDKEWTEWKVLHDRALLDVTDREEALARVYDEVEKDCVVCGVTGIEDKLQQDVPSTLAVLRHAGMKVWMLTGDKQQTAEEIGRSSGLIQPADAVHVLQAVTAQTLGSAMGQLERQLALPPPLSSHPQSNPPSSLSASHTPSYALIIDGATLSLALLHHSTELYHLSSHAVSVICCRVTPSQKAAVTSLIQSHGHITLAVGDGGNDVSMLQTANVGVGISGREGMQAARASDFSIARFSFLTRLLLVHGRWSYVRTSWISQYCLYKSMIICMVQLLFAIPSRFSGASFFDSLSIVSYNLFYTSLIGAFYLFEQDLLPSTLLTSPHLYQTTHLSHTYNRQTLSYWWGRALYQSLVISFIAAFTSLGSSADWLTDHNQMGVALTAYSSIVFVQCLTLYLELHYITLLHHVLIWGTMLGFFILNLAVSASSVSEAEGVFLLLLSDPVYWFSVILGVTLCLLPLFATKGLWQDLWPTDVDVAHEMEVKALSAEQLTSRSAPAPSPHSPLTSSDTRKGKRQLAQRGGRAGGYPAPDVGYCVLSPVWLSCTACRVVSCPVV